MDMYETTLDARPAEVTRARARTRGTLRVWGADALVEAAETVVTEMLANAVLHTQAPARLRLTMDGSASEDHAGGDLRIDVFDGSGAPPTARDSDIDDPGGWGLDLIGAIADEWGWEPRDDGKAVWCRLAAANRTHGADGAGETSGQTA